MNGADTRTTLETNEIPAETGEKGALAFTGADKALMPCMLVCGFFYWEWILFGGETALGVSLFILLLCGVTLPYLAARGARQSRASLPCIAVLCLSCVQFAVFDTTVLQFFNLIFTALVYLYWISVSCGTRLSGRLSGHVAFDMLNQCALTPFGNFAALFIGIRRSVREMKRGKELIAAAVGLLVFLPLFSVVLSLLTEADDAFDALWRAIQQHVRLPDLARYAAEFILGIPVAAYLYGAAFGNASKRRAGILSEDAVSKGLLKVRLVPNMAFCAPLVVFNAFYALFFAALGNYFFSAFAGRLPAAVSYAEYARKGFFELCGVASVNLAIIACVCLLMRRGGNERPRAVRVLTGLMSAFTVLLIVTAISKMFLYISAYGLTRLRVYTSWFMLLLLIVFALLLLWHFRAFDPAKPLIIAFVVCFTALTWADTDSLIAKYNISQYESGKAAALDVQLLGTLSDAAAPHVFAAWEREKAYLMTLPAYGSEDANAFVLRAAPGRILIDRRAGRPFVFRPARGGEDSASHDRTDDIPRLLAALEGETDPPHKAELAHEFVTALMYAAWEDETDPRAKTALELGRTLLEDAYPNERSAFSEQNAQAFRAAALSERVLRDLTVALSAGEQ